MMGHKIRIPELEGADYETYRSRIHHTTPKPGIVEQFELSDNGKGKVKGVMVRTWKNDFSEGAVGDDIAGKIHIVQEDKGIWKIGG
ncbi:MAG: phytase [Phycisphaerales bacterium]|jgi:myo-inositol-hexaphosphate 3-phosphohydrolase|nr:phytase [Phycisphaerales bacterium]